MGSGMESGGEVLQSPQRRRVRNIIMIDTLAIVGVGLLGGSVALAARARCVARRIVGVVRPEEAETTRLRPHLVDAVYTEISPAVPRATLVVLCTPVDLIAAQARKALALGPHAVITDVGSTKHEIVEEVEAGQGGCVRFVGGHPLAGSEKSGAGHARAELFQGRTTFLTPTPRTDPRATELVMDFWTRLGACVELMDAQEHDRTLAVTSHLPHLVAFALAALLPEDCLPYAGTGWRDTTRLAGSDPRLWASIALANRDHLLAAGERLQLRLGEIQRGIASRNGAELVRLFEEGRKARDALGS